MPYQKPKRGWIELICGGMFAGKSEELLRRIRLAEIARQQVQVFKPAVDDRYGEDVIASHNGMRRDARIIRAPEEMLRLVEAQTRVVAVDEAQFFVPSLADVCGALADRGLRVIVAGTAGHRRGTGSGFPWRAIWIHPPHHGPGGVRGQTAGHLSSMRSSGLSNAKAH